MEKRVRVRAECRMYEDHRAIEKGEVFATTEERAKALGSSVSIVGGRRAEQKKEQEHEQEQEKTPENRAVKSKDVRKR